MANHRATVLTSAIDAIHAMQEIRGSSAKSIKDFMKTYPITGIPTRVQSATLVKVLNLAVKDDILRCEKGRYKIASRTLLRKLQLDDASKGGVSESVDILVDACRRKRRRRSCRRKRRRSCRRKRRRSRRRRRRSCRRRRRRSCRRKRRRSRRRSCRRKRRSRRRRRRSCRRKRRRSCRRSRRRRKRRSCRRRRRRSRRRSCRRRKRRRSSCRRRRKLGSVENELAEACTTRRRHSNGRKPDDGGRSTRRTRKDKGEVDPPPPTNQQTNEMAMKGQRRRRNPHEDMDPDVRNNLEGGQPAASVANGAVVCEDRSQ